MDLSGLKWPAIILVLVGIFWLGTSGGVNYMVSKYTSHVPGQDARQDAIDEAGLTRVGYYLLSTLQFSKAAYVIQLALDRYGQNGANYWINVYRLATCMDRLERYQESYDLLQILIGADAQQYDERIPNVDVLRARAAKLKEVHELR
ncbi:MAG TPA: hypothetical protein PK349_02865 [Candidatus Hydrogenedentes bacterium]|nr:hypothetical protein [Candidatus Hydrogenedentota bacterium]HOV59988.1 hypothetical protein [Candidatus Hydrogenedentota bacterium]